MPESKSDIDVAIRSLKKMRKFYANEKKTEDEKKKKDQPPKSGFSVIEWFFILNLVAPFVGIGYIWCIAKMLTLIGINIR